MTESQRPDGVPDDARPLPHPAPAAGQAPEPEEQGDRAGPAGRSAAPERTRPTRRRLLGAAVGATGLAVGAAVGVGSGVALASDANPPPARPSGLHRFRDKVVLITGATSGIGRSAAKAFAAEGALVGFCGRRADRGRQVEAEIRAAGGQATYIRADVRDEQSVQDFVDRVVATYGGLHVAFNNAGVTIQKPLHELGAADFDQVIGTNLRGCFLSMKYEIPHMIKGGGGTIVVTSSTTAISTGETRAAYAASKRGLVGLVQAATFDYASHGIRINTLLPGPTNTELVRRAAGMEGVPDQAWQVFIDQWAHSHVPGLQRMATPDEVAQFALVLACDDHPFLTGAQLVIDGGKTAHD